MAPQLKQGMWESVSRLRFVGAFVMVMGLLVLSKESSYPLFFTGSKHAKHEMKNSTVSNDSMKHLSSSTDSPEPGADIPTNQLYTKSPTKKAPLSKDNFSDTMERCNISSIKARYFKDVINRVVIQVDNRITFDGSLEEFNLPAVSVAFNSLKAKEMGMEYLFFQAKKGSCGTSKGVRFTSYWCKVYYIYMASLLFPNAAGILFLDSDAFLGADITRIERESGILMANKDSIYVGIDDAWWSNVLNSQVPRIVVAPLNSGSIYFNPSSHVVRKMLYEWWYFEPYHYSNLELKTSIFCYEFQTNVSETDLKPMIWRFLLDEMQLQYPLMYKYYRDLPSSVLLNQHYNVDMVQQIGNESSVFFRSPNVAGFCINNLTNMLGDSPYIFAQNLDSNISEAHLNMKEHGFRIDLRNSNMHNFVKEWPGDQERLQNLQVKYRENIKVVPNMQYLWAETPENCNDRWKSTDLFYKSNLDAKLKCGVWHADYSFMVKEEARVAVLSLLQTRYSDAEINDILKQVRRVKCIIK